MYSETCKEGWVIGIKSICGRNPKMAAFAMLYVMACLQDEWSLPREYGDTLEIVKGLEENFQSF